MSQKIIIRQTPWKPEEVYRAFFLGITVLELRDPEQGDILTIR